jgi:hypothetical protein
VGGFFVADKSPAAAIRRRKQLEFALLSAHAVRTDPLFGPVIGYGATMAGASWRDAAPLNRRLAVD